MKWMGMMGGAGLALGAAVDAKAAFLVIDDFAGGPDVVSLVSLAPPQLATGTFAHGGALGGLRDVFVASTTVGSFQSGVAFGTGGYASFSGNGYGGIIWDGVVSAVDGNADGSITVDDFDFGLSFDTVTDCVDPYIHVNAFADLAGGTVDVIFANTAVDYAVYTIPLTTVGAFDDYFIDVLSPTTVFGLYDPADVKAVGLFVDGTTVANLDVRVALLGVECPPIPESGTWIAMAGLVGVAGLGLRRARAARRA